MQTGKAILLLTALATGGIAKAQEAETLDLRRGTLQYVGLPGKGNPFALSEAQSKAFRENFAKLVTIVRQAPVFNPPLGFEARGRSEFFEVGSDEAPRPGQPARGRMILVLYYFFNEGGKVSWGGEANTSFELRINDPRSPLAWARNLADVPSMYFEPREVRRVAGIPVYDCDVMVITGNGRVPWLPVTREQYLKAVIASRQAMLDETTSRSAKAGSAYATWLADRPKRLKDMNATYERVKKTNPAQAEELRSTMLKMEDQIGLTLAQSEPAESNQAVDFIRANLASLRAKLDRMTAEERKQPAWYRKPDDSDPMGSGLVAAGSADARALVMDNPDLFDRAISASQIQLVTVRFEFGGLSETHIGTRRLLECETGIHWQQIAAQVH